MGTELYVSTSGAIARLQQLEFTANNLANVDTLGYKADRPQFQAALESQILNGAGEAASGEPARSFVALAGVTSDHKAGSIAGTGRALDAAIEGPGFFAVETPGGIRYTRAGSFIVDPNGTLSTLDGRPVLGDGGPIQVGTTQAEIRPSGEVVDSQGDVLGQLRVEVFDDPRMLQKEGANLFRAPPNAVGIPAETVHVLPRSVERSNVKAVEELATMMILQRQFDASMQVMRADDNSTDQLIREFGQ
ncbi:MAG: flagellar basal-body rod protein FlgF [bacterium]|nr:flagellar basal-body rod protein FlgF [bacterium]